VAIVSPIIALGQTLDFSIVAEGVERRTSRKRSPTWDAIHFKVICSAIRRSQSGSSRHPR